MVETNFKTIEDVLRSNLVNNEDKKRIIQCYYRVKIWHDSHTEEWDRGQLNINRDLYRVNLDKTVTYIKDVSGYTSIRFKNPIIL